MRRILQFVPTLMPGDATGMHTLMIERALQERGIETRIYVEEVKTNQIGNATRFTNYAKENRHDDILLYHLAAPSAIADFLSSRNETLAIVYHNITPSHFFEQWDTVAASGQIWARAQLSRLAGRTTLALPVSNYNQEELLDLGYGQSKVVPILIDHTSFVSGSDPSIESMLRMNKRHTIVNFLFVGRLVPNKAQHNLIAAVSAYKHIYGNGAILHLVGRPFSREYLDLLKRIAQDLDVRDNVNFALGVTKDELASYYRECDALVSLSEHEGFCVPLIEAMHHRLPIVAFDTSAIKETLGGSGVLIPTNDAVTTAVAMHRITHDHQLRRILEEKMTLRLNELGLEKVKTRLYQALAILEPGLLKDPVA